mmetsp:Transcript_45894/g.93666  ORF Transcript_45894/g.93666 Transcript_45894/m.93666 type:complete len:123 (-) Transcript_45894:332-700(-)
MYIHRQRALYNYPKLPLFRWLRMPQEEQCPEADGNLRHQHRKLQPPPLQASCSGAALPGHRIRELVEGHIQMQELRGGAMRSHPTICGFWGHPRMLLQLQLQPPPLQESIPMTLFSPQVSSW